MSKLSYKQKEERLAFVLSLYGGTDVQLAKDEYSTYDAYTDKAIMEFKIRSSYYEQKMLEVKKLESGLAEAKKQNKKFLYVVKDPKGIYILDVSKHEDTIRAVGTTMIPQPKYTAFNTRDKDQKVDVEFYLFPMNLINKIIESNEFRKDRE